MGFFSLGSLFPTDNCMQAKSGRRSAQIKNVTSQTYLKIGSKNDFLPISQLWMDS